MLWNINNLCCFFSYTNFLGAAFIISFLVENAAIYDTNNKKIQFCINIWKLNNFSKLTKILIFSLEIGKSLNFNYLSCVSAIKRYWKIWSKIFVKRRILEKIKKSKIYYEMSITCSTFPWCPKFTGSVFKISYIFENEEKFVICVDKIQFFINIWK